MNAGKRHPILGFFAGLLLGLSVAQLLIVFKVIAISSAVPLIVVVVLTVLGVVWALFGPARGRKAKKSATATT